MSCYSSRSTQPHFSCGYGPTTPRRHVAVPRVLVGLRQCEVERERRDGVRPDEKPARVAEFSETLERSDEVDAGDRKSVTPRG